MKLKLATAGLLCLALSACQTAFQTFTFNDKYPKVFDDKHNTVHMHSQFDEQGHHIKNRSDTKRSKPLVTFNTPPGVWQRFGVDYDYFPSEKDGIIFLTSGEGTGVTVIRWDWLSASSYEDMRKNKHPGYPWISGVKIMHSDKIYPDGKNAPYIMPDAPTWVKFTPVATAWARFRLMSKNQFYCANFLSEPRNAKPNWDKSNNQQQWFGYEYAIICPFRTNVLSSELAANGWNVNTTGQFHIIARIGAEGRNQQELDSNIDKVIAHYEEQIAIPILNTLKLADHLYQFKTPKP
ncbi:hypothetical protein [Moraxella marmotae]|uniref:hypothetical protein n=1 Tax=Moraxella marmotae TaxID=3344520 RepID=UPI0035F4D380